MSKKRTTTEQPIEDGNDLDQLRNILYGNQARATEQRLTDLEVRIETVQRDLSDDINQRAASLANSASTQLTDVQQKLTDQLNQTAVDFNQRLDKQIKDIQKSLADFRAEARQRDNDLRQEMLTLGAMLDKQKAGRTELGELLVQLGQQLQENAASTPTETKE